MCYKLERRHEAATRILQTKFFNLATLEGCEAADRALAIVTGRVDYDDPSVPINTTNIVNYKGKPLDVSAYSSTEISTLLASADPITAHQIQSTARAKALYHASIPTTLLHYPEPYTAAPSLIHDDIPLVHIIQYQF